MRIMTKLLLSVEPLKAAETVFALSPAKESLIADHARSGIAAGTAAPQFEKAPA